MALDFLICSERSGSNLVTRMLDSHPLVCGPPPSHLIRTLARNLLRYGDLAGDAAWRALTEDVADLLTHQLGAWQSRWTAAEIRRQVRERSLAAVIRTVYEAEARAAGKARAFVKENQAYTFLPYLLAAFPAARYVLLVRDPRDVALSWKRSPNHPGGVLRAARTWQTDQEQSLLCYGYLRDTGRMHLVRYEDLLAEPAAVMERVCDFLALPFSAEVLRFHDRPTTRANAARIKDWANLGRPVLQNNARKYPGALAAAEVRYVEAVCRTEMAWLGYPPDHPPGDPAALEAEVARVAAATPEPSEALSADEHAIRARRLQVIRRICSRAPAGGTSDR